MNSMGRMNTPNACDRRNEAGIQTCSFSVCVQDINIISASVHRQTPGLTDIKLAMRNLKYAPVREFIESPPVWFILWAGYVADDGVSTISQKQLDMSRPTTMVRTDRDH